MEEGAEPPAEEAALPPPPTAAVFRNDASDYNINSAFKNQNPANGGPETKASVRLEPNSGISPIPASQNQFSARGRMGVRSRYKLTPHSYRFMIMCISISLSMTTISYFIFFNSDMLIHSTRLVLVVVVVVGH